MVNKQDQSEAKNQETTIEDLTINPDQTAEVKGGEIKDHKNWINVSSCNIGSPSR